jgi:hypothetical protein
MWAITRLRGASAAQPFSLDSTSADEGVQIASGDAHVPTELGVGDAALEDEPADEPLGGA